MPLITLDEFQRSLTVNGYAPAPRNYYDVICRDASRSGGIETRRELAMFLAQIYHESGGLVHRQELNPMSNYGQYYGRGFIQLTWEDNYSKASQALYGDNRLVRNPDLVLDEEVSWLVSFWYWRARVHNAPGVQEGEFGAATNAINGELECRGPHQDKARRRFEIYKNIFRVFQLDGEPDESGCYRVHRGGSNQRSSRHRSRAYTIQPGDTLWAIAQREGTHLDDILASNPGINPNNLQIGQIINLP